MIAHPMKILVSKSELVQASVLVLSVLYACELILETNVHLTYIIYKLRIDPVHLVDVRETITAEIYIGLIDEICIYSLRKAKVLDITEEKHTLPLLTIAEREPR